MVKEPSLSVERTRRRPVAVASPEADRSALDIRQRSASTEASPEIRRRMEIADEGIRYHGLDGVSKGVQVETCSAGHSHIEHQRRAHPGDDDIAACGLDPQIAEEGLRRAGSALRDLTTLIGIRTDSSPRTAGRAPHPIDRPSIPRRRGRDRR